MPPPSRTTSPARLLPHGLLCGLLCGLTCSLFGACAVLPNWSHQETREFSVLVDYEVDGDDDFVVLPASNDWLTVLQLHTRPGWMRESFKGNERRVHLPPRTRYLQVLCRYKLYLRRDEDGRLLPWPTPAELFPGAARIRHNATGESDFHDFPEDQE